MVIPVDYSDPLAVVPDGVLWNQRSVDQMLARLGGTNFKYVMQVWDALPPFIRHEVRIDLAAGIHRSHLTSAYLGGAITLSGKIIGANVTIAGAPVSQWDPVDPTLVGLTIDSYQTNNDPYADVSTSHPGIFSGFDLKGYWARMGPYVSPIHDHTNDRIHVLANISPTPTTLDIVKPATVIQNDDGADNLKFLANAFLITDNLFTSPDIVFSVEDVSCRLVGDEYPALFIIGSGKGSSYFSLNRVHVDGSKEGINSNGAALFGGWFLAQGMSIRGKTTSGQDGAIRIIDSKASMYGTMIYSWDDTALYSSNSDIFLLSTVIDRAAFSGNEEKGGAIEHSGPGYFEAYGGASFYGLLNCVVRNVPDVSPPSGSASVVYLNDAIRYPGATFPFSLRFENCRGPLVHINGKSALDFSASATAAFVDGGGNTDIAFKITGPRASLVLNAGTDLTTPQGDIEMADGDILSLATVAADGPYVDLVGLNTVDKAT